MGLFIFMVFTAWLLVVVIIGVIESTFDKDETQQTYYTNYNYNQKKQYRYKGRNPLIFFLSI